MSFVDFSRIGSAKADLNRKESFYIASADIREKSEHYNFYSESDLTPVKPSGTPNAKALKWVGIALGVTVTIGLIITLVVCLVIFLGDGRKYNHNGDGKTTLLYQKDRSSSTAPLQTTESSGLPATTSITTERSNLNISTSTLSTTSSGNIISNGTWSNWGPWTMCAVTCGNSTHSRYRTCIKNAVTDRNCVGDFKEQKKCTTNSCPVYGKWTTWESWSSCDVTCGGGTQTRSRTCKKIANTDKDCFGRTTQQQSCSDWTCPDCTKSCTTGSLNIQCEVCECSTNVQGLVKNSNGGLLNNVTVVHESAPYRELTTTNENGTFELNSVCNQHSIIFKKAGYQDTFVNITSSYFSVEMNLIQYPVITVQPKSHLRLQGEFVEFCCNATGNPAITSYEWLKDGNLLNESFYRDGTTLILNDLKFTDTGNVICRANSPAGAVFSNSVSLSVRENPDDFCSDAYESYEIDLPSDCIQEDTNSVKYDIGKCSPKNCRMNDSNTEQSCSVDKKYCCIPNRKEKRIIKCTDYSFPLFVTTSCSCGECEDSDINLYGQAVGATSGAPLRFGTIEVDGNSAVSTGVVGDFSFTVPRGTTRIAVLFKDTFFNQFSDTLKIIRLNEELSGSFYIHVKMIEKTTPINIYSNVSNMLYLGDQDGSKRIASVTIPPNSIFYPDGTRYNGEVKASVNFFDPRNSSSIENAPGEFVTIDQEGQTQNLQTFGVFSLTLQDQSGSSLQIAGETEIELDQTFFETTSIGNLSDAKIWGLNVQTGVWEEQATLNVLSSKRKKRQAASLFVSLDISAYRWINIDKIVSTDRCYFKTEVFEGNTQLRNYRVDVIVDGSSSSFYRFSNYVYRDSECWTVCKNEETLRGYISVSRQNKHFQIDTSNSGLLNSTKTFIDYKIMVDNRTVSAKNIMSDDGPFYSSSTANFQEKFRFKFESKDYEFKVANPSFEEAIKNNYTGSEVWYPPLNSFRKADMQYRSCFIKIGTVNANANVTFRVISLNNDSTILGIHEKGLTNGAACIEYRCSGRDPDFDLRRAGSNDFYRYPTTYTRVKIRSLGQFCNVRNESSILRTQEKSIMKFSSPQSNIYYSVFEAYIPDNEFEGIYFHKSNTFNNIDDAREKAIKECNTGIHSSFSGNVDDMMPNMGLAMVFKCF